MLIGILGFQGCIKPHEEILEKLSAPYCRVRTATELERCSHLIIPGGESTTMLGFLKRNGLDTEIQRFAKTRPIWGICAGAILIAKEVSNPVQPSLGLTEISAQRNFYGSQLDSFTTEIEFEPLKIKLPVDFIRAPLLNTLSRSVSVYAYHDKQPVWFEQGRIVASSFHIELSGDPRLHQYFIAKE